MKFYAFYFCASSKIYFFENLIRTDALEKVGGTSLVIKEGGLSAFAAFAVTWIITFTVMNS